MSTLLNKANQILAEKTQKIVPENITEDLTIFNVTGNIPVVSNIKLEATNISFGLDNEYRGFIYANANIRNKQLINTGTIQMNVRDINIASVVNLTPNILKDGENILGVIGSFQGLNTSDATATAGDIVQGKTAYVNGQLINGSIYKLNGEVGLPVTNLRTIYPDDSTEGLTGYTYFDIYNNGIYFTQNSRIMSSIQSSDIVNACNITPNNLKKGYNLFGLTGNYEGLNTSDATATVSDIASGKTAYVNGQKLTGDLYEVRANNSFYDESMPYYESNYMKFPMAYNVLARENSIFISHKSGIVSALNLTSNMIVQGYNILGIEGTGGGQTYENLDEEVF